MKLALAFIVAMAVAPWTAFAGELSSDFRGHVVDATGQPVAGAVMVVEHVDTGRVTRHTTNQSGRWSAMGKRSDGTYRIACYAPGTHAPVVTFQGRVALGQVHVRNCVIGTLNAASPAWLSSWKWRQAAGDRYVKEAA
ncbi:carboxypeptidase-like regulatory domain-containing protein [Pseudoxanthomonas mexicana]